MRPNRTRFLVEVLVELVKPVVLLEEAYCNIWRVNSNSSGHRYWVIKRLHLSAADFEVEHVSNLPIAPLILIPDRY